MEEGSIKSEFVTIHGRGDLHLGVLIEKMRREGYEMSVMPPQVMMKEEDGVLMEPYEEAIIETDLDYVNGIIDKMNNRKGVMMNIEELKDGR